MIMKKRTYIQPEMAVDLLHMESIMIPSSPTDGNMDPSSSDPSLAPQRETPYMFWFSIIELGS